MARVKSKRIPHHRRLHSIPNRVPPSGFIFTCDRVTKPECFRSQLFGLPISKIESVVTIEPGTALFLFDCELRILYGVYRAASHGGANLVPHAFGGKYQSQVKFEIDRNCHPLPESVFRHAIQENYSRGRFRPALDYPQVSRLLSLFQDTGAPSQPPRHPVDSRSAHQTARPPTLTDPPYIPSAAPPPLNNQFYSAPPNDSYSLAAAPSPPQLRDQYYAAPTGYATAPPTRPPSNDQIYAAHPYYPAQPPSNGQYYAAQPNYKHYPAPPNYPAQSLAAQPNYKHYPAPPNYPAQPPRVPPANRPPIHQYYPAPPNNPYYRGRMLNYYPGNAVPA